MNMFQQMSTLEAIKMQLMAITTIFLHMEMANPLLGFKIIYVLMVLIDGITTRRPPSMFSLFLLMTWFTHRQSDIDLSLSLFFVGISVIFLDEAVVLHYTYSRFSDLTSRHDRCGCKPTREDVKRCFMLQFDRSVSFFCVYCNCSCSSHLIFCFISMQGIHHCFNINFRGNASMVQRTCCMD